MKDNLTLTMHYFGKLDDAEKKLFLSVVASENHEPVQSKKPKKAEKYEYSEEYFYIALKREWQEKALKRQEKNKFPKVENNNLNIKKTIGIG